MDKFEFLGNTGIENIDKLYRQYLENPESVEESWQNFFRGFDFAKTDYQQKPSSKQPSQEECRKIDNEFKVINVIEDYRRRGHLFTKTNPVRQRRSYFPTLDLSNYGLSNKDLDTVYQAGNQIGIGAAKLRDIVNFLKQTYCNAIGVEYLYIRNPQVVAWLQHKMEKEKNTPKYTAEQRKHIYFHLRMAVGFEQFIHKKFIGQKRFSLEGAESLIPALDAVIEKGAELGIEEFIIGMPHRGRLNVLANILQKPYENIFKEFVGKEYDENIALGDVKYHLGYGNDIQTDTGKTVRLNLAPNPSHLEMVAPVVQGIARGMIHLKYNDDYNKLAPIIIHGDAAIAAQGIVYETIQMSGLKGYKTGGTIHLVINNQVGFTTNYPDARTSTYCTDIAKVTRSPVFHVNGDNPEALIYTIRLAMEFRQRFRSDVFIDLLCYRKYGHNEGDEPRFTQPVLYEKISKHPNVRDIYSKQLIEEKIYSKQDVEDAEKDFEEILEMKFEKSKDIDKVTIKRFLADEWKRFKNPDDNDFLTSLPTNIDKDVLLEVTDKITILPEEKLFFRKIEKLVKERKKMVENGKLDWAMAELMAYGSLLLEDKPVRISGQDSERGTFSHRHAAFVVQNSDEKYFPLKHLSPKQASFHVYNSLLSEYGVLGFEYGYALAMPNGLTIWEAQFGDFHNVAQAIIDQYISSAEEKWGLRNGLVVLLPHGYEGQGPEHSSARMERFLTMAARNNMQIANCTTPANFFHLLRRQVHRDFRIPLIVFTPKSLLRHPKVVSPVEHFTSGKFEEVFDDENVIPEKVSRLVFCSGKVYYDLLEKKEEYDAKDLALIRIEQLYPFPLQKLKKIIKKYPNTMLNLWVQEEPENMGAWRFISHAFKGIDLVPVCRLASGSPAVGLNQLHKAGQAEIVRKVFRKCDCELNNIYCGLQCVVGGSREEILKQHFYLYDDKE